MKTCLHLKNISHMILLLGLLFGPVFIAFSPVAYAATDPTPSGGEAASYRIYIPVMDKEVTGSPSTAPTPTPEPTPNVPPPADGHASFFLPWDIGGEANATDGPDLKVDPAGGLHVAYTAYTGDANGNRPVYYTYCPASCTDPASFSTPVAFAVKADHVNLALDPQGHPRLLWVGIDPSGQNLNAFMFAICNTGCTSLANWTVTRLLSLDTSMPHNSHFFSISSQGMNGFIYYIDMVGSSKGTYLAYCSTNCTDSASWFQNRLTTDQLEFPVLVFTKAGLPRVAASYTSYQVDPPVTSLVYLECDETCQNFTQGASFPLKTCSICDLQKGYLSLALDANDRPRMALYTGPLDPGGPLEANRLYYLFCNSNCGDLQNSGWDGYSLGLPSGVGPYVDLRIDAQNQPRLAYENETQGLDYSWCSAGCETASPTWHTLLADSSDALDLSEPVPAIPPCTVAGWFTGKRPSLALDAAGNPRIVYDAEHWQGLDPVDYPPGAPGCPGFKMDEINARLTLFNQP